MFYALLKWNTSTWESQGVRCIWRFASSAATIAGVAIFYVKQPDGQQVVQPNKDVIQMPTLGAFARLSKLPPEAIDLFRSVFTQKEDDPEEKSVLLLTEIWKCDWFLGFPYPPRYPREYR